MSDPGRPATPVAFAVDAAFATRIAALGASIGEAFTGAVIAAAEPSDGALVPAAAVLDLVGAFGLRSAREAAVLAIPAARTLARPPISGYRVGAVGLTIGGDLLLGGNLEFPGASIHHTVHGEGFVTLRARSLGMAVDTLAIDQARPCAHCRQVLTEMAWSTPLRIVDPAGHDLSLADLYPWPFAPEDLDRARAGASASARGPALAPGAGVPPDVATALARAGARAHAPYSGEPAAVVVRAADGRQLGGSVLESVAFNPTIGPLQDALVALVAARVPLGDITDAWLAVAAGARVDHVRPTRDLLSAVAPGARLEVTYWS